MLKGRVAAPSKNGSILNQFHTCPSTDGMCPELCMVTHVHETRDPDIKCGWPEAWTVPNQSFAQSSILWACGNACCHSVTDGPPFCFQLAALMNQAILNILVCDFGEYYILISEIPGFLLLLILSRWSKFIFSFSCSFPFTFVFFFFFTITKYLVQGNVSRRGLFGPRF